MATAEVQCPVDGEILHVELTLVGDPPVFDLNAPEVIEHFKKAH